MSTAAVRAAAAAHARQTANQIAAKSGITLPPVDGAQPREAAKTSASTAAAATGNGKMLAVSSASTASSSTPVNRRAAGSHAKTSPSNPTTLHASKSSVSSNASTGSGSASTATATTTATNDTAASSVPAAAASSSSSGGAGSSSSSSGVGELDLGINNPLTAKGSLFSFDVDDLKRDEIMEIWNTYDRNRDGALEAEEFILLLKHCIMHMKATVPEMIEAYARDFNVTTESLSEVTAALQRRFDDCHLAGMAHDMLKKMDSNSDGTVTASEFRVLHEVMDAQMVAEFGKFTAQCLSAPQLLEIRKV